MIRTVICLVEASWFRWTITARVELFPDHGIGIFLSSNSAAGADAHTLFSRAMVDALSGSPAPEASIPEVAERLTDQALYEGEYVYDGVPVATFDRFPKLMSGGSEVRGARTVG